MRSCARALAASGSVSRSHRCPHLAPHNALTDALTTPHPAAPHPTAPYPTSERDPDGSVAAMAVLSSVVVYRGAEEAMRDPAAVLQLKMWPSSAVDIIIAFPIFTLRYVNFFGSFVYFGVRTICTTTACHHLHQSTPPTSHLPPLRSYLCHFNTLSIMASLYEPTRARMSRVIFNAVGFASYLFDSLFDCTLHTTAHAAPARTPQLHCVRTHYAPTRYRSAPARASTCCSASVASWSRATR